MLLTRQEAIEYLDAHIGDGPRPGLERITGLLDLMGNPEGAYPIIHVAGTNGKTSVARMATMLLIAHGITTGTFTSPHLERIEERFSLNGVPATPDQFVQATVDLKAFADIYEERSGHHLTYFELTAALAFSWFADQAVGAAVVEVGLGGRLDATNALHGDVAVLTEVGLEHTRYLGDTLEEIAGEKLAIVEPNGVLVTGPLQPEVDSVAVATATNRKATLHRYGHDFRVTDARRSVGGWRVDIEGVEGEYEDLFLPIHGRHQTLNLAVAIAATEALVGRPLDDAAVGEAAQIMSSPGRMEPVGADPLILLDGAHNPDGFAALGAALREEFPSIRWVLVTGAMNDKKLQDMYPRLRGLVSDAIATESDAVAAIPATGLAERLAELLDIPVTPATSVAAAVDEARDRAGPDGAVLVTGSLYLVGAVRALLAGTPRDRNER